MPGVNTNLRQARTQAGFSQEALAQQAMISRQAYAAIESGRSVPSTEVALRLARSLRTTVEALFSLAGEAGLPVEAELIGRIDTVREGTRVQLAQVGPRLLARPLQGEAATLHVLSRADGTVASAVRAGQRASVSLLDDAEVKAPTVLMVGCDPAVVFLMALLQERGVRLMWSEEGSRDALRGLERGEAHVAGCHLLDEESGRFNVPWVHRLVSFPCTVVGFAIWRQGFMVAPGNPKGIRHVEDLASPGVKIINRQEGSGSRLLLDRLLQHQQVPVAAVQGYQQHVRGHLAVAEVVAAGLADAGVGVKVAATALGLDFIPLGEERYDLVIPDHFLELLSVRVMLDTLNRPALRRQVEGLGGYDITIMGQPASANSAQ